MKTIRQKRIFIVDDNPYWVSLQTQMLKELGFENIITYSNGTDCINHLHLNPAIVFLDYQMEDKNGLEVLQRIKDYYPGISVVFCTGQPDLGIAVSAMKLGSFDYLPKENLNSKKLSRVISALSVQPLSYSKVY